MLDIRNKVFTQMEDCSDICNTTVRSRIHFLFQPDRPIPKHTRTSSRTSPSSNLLVSRRVPPDGRVCPRLEITIALERLLGLVYIAVSNGRHISLKLRTAQNRTRLTMPSIKPVLLVLISAHLPILDLLPAQSQLTLGQAHTAQELDATLPLGFLARRTPLEFLAHEIDDLGQGLEGRLRVEEGQPGPPGQDIRGALGVLVADGVADLAVDERVEVGDALAADGEALFGRGAEGGDLPGAVAVGFAEVLCDVGLDAVVLDQVDEEGFAPAVGADQLDLVRLAGAVEGGAVVDDFSAGDAGWGGKALGAEAEFLEGFVDGLFGHLAVGSPFAARDGDQAGLRGRDEVVADEAFGLGFLGVADERADTGPGGEDVAAADGNVGLQVVLDFGEDPVDFFFAGDGVLVDVAGGVSCAGNGITLPGEEEDDTAVGG